MEDLEDSVASLSAPVDDGEVVIKPRKLGRLRKAGAALENAQPNHAPAPASPGQPAAKERGQAESLHESPSSAVEQQGRAAAAGEEEVVAAETGDAAAGAEAAEASPSKEVCACCSCTTAAAYLLVPVSAILLFSCHTVMHPFSL